LSSGCILGKEIKNIVIIGSGNVAYHMINAFIRRGIHVLQILAHNERTAGNLSENFSVPYTIKQSNLNTDADLYILTVQDDLIREVALSLGLKDQLLVHTSGFSSIEEIKGTSTCTGVMWPLQTLTFGKELDYSHIPFFIEGHTRESTEKLARFAGRVSDNVIITSSSARQKVHLAAVIASNLANQLYAIAASILERQEIPFSVLAPLIRETAEKAGSQHPMLSQTGPAARKDFGIIQKHLELLRDEPAFLEIYRLITENIIHLHSKGNEKL
jgi:predicted short-subunit dehydrogenase-like oxidoreductase (DUF2520 family)